MFSQMNAVWNDWVDPANPPCRACVRADLARPGGAGRDHGDGGEVATAAARARASAAPQAGACAPRYSSFAGRNRLLTRNRRRSERLGRPARGHPGHRPDAGAGRPVRDPEPRRSRRRGVQDRAARQRRRDPPLPALRRRREPLFPRHQPQQEKPRRRPAAGGKGKEILRRLVATADILVENYRPGRDGPARARL